MRTTKIARKVIQAGSIVLTDKTASGCLDVLAENFSDFDESRLEWLLNRERHQTDRSKASVVMVFGGKALKFTQAYPTSSTVNVEFDREAANAGIQH